MKERRCDFDEQRGEDEIPTDHVRSFFGFRPLLVDGAQFQQYLMQRMIGRQKASGEKWGERERRTRFFGLLAHSVPTIVEILLAELVHVHKHDEENVEQGHCISLSQRILHQVTDENGSRFNSRRLSPATHERSSQSGHFG